MRIRCVLVMLYLVTFSLNGQQAQEFKSIFDGGECRGVHCFPRRIRRRRRRRPSRIRI